MAVYRLVMETGSRSRTVLEMDLTNEQHGSNLVTLTVKVLIHPAHLEAEQVERGENKSSCPNSS